MFLGLFITPVIADAAPQWKVELSETIQNYDFLEDGKYLFFTNAEYL
jgi:hypothetical protein